MFLVFYIIILSVAIVITKKKLFIKNKYLFILLYLIKYKTIQYIMSIKYSIIIPHFNRPDLIINGINSFKELKNKEIIIIDAGSNEDNIQKLKQNLKQISYDQNINLFLTSKRLNISEARNKGLNIATGKWIYFIDDDDDARPKFIKFLNKGRLKEKYDFYRFPNIEKQNGKFERFILKILPWNQKYSPQISTYLFKKHFLDKNNISFYENINYGEDRYFQMIVLNQKKIRIKYKHIFSFNYNKFSSINSLMRNQSINPSKNLKIIDDILNTNYKNKKVFALELLVSDFYWVFRNDIYKEINESIAIYKNYVKKINPKFTTFFQMDIASKFLYLIYLFNIKLKK